MSQVLGLSKILKIFQKSKNLLKFWKSSKNLKILVPKQASKGQTMSPIELFWTAKKNFMSYETPSLPMWEKRNCQVGQSTVWGVNTFWLERPQEFGQGFKKRKNSTPAKYLETHIIQLKSSLNGRGLKKVSSLVFIFSYGKLVLLCNFSIQFQMLCK